MKPLRRLLPSIFILVLGTAGGLAYVQHSQELVRADVEAYLNEAQRIEQLFLKELPRYDPGAYAEKEKELRRHLLADHLRLAEESGLPLLADDEALGRGISAGQLEQIQAPGDALFYFYNVPRKYRVLAPHTRAGLELVAERFQANLRKRADLPPVKIAVSSVVRPVSYQRQLRRSNANATGASSHSFGLSFDLFYDDFYVVLPPVPRERALSASILELLRPRLGYLLGDALARQLRVILMETLIELQTEGRLYAILERNQRCYHVSILEQR